MSYELIALRPFERDVKRLNKKYPSLGADIKALSQDLHLNPFIGASIGRNCRKIRMAITFKG